MVHHAEGRQQDAFQFIWDENTHWDIGPKINARFCRHENLFLIVASSPAAGFCPKAFHEVINMVFESLLLLFLEFINS
jgi:hypothetical protein